MYLINDTYFIDYTDIPNVDEPDTKAAAQLERRIDEMGRLFVLEALGATLKTELDGYLVNGLLPVVPDAPAIDPVPVKWRNLVTGCTYTVDGIDKVWKGLLWQEGTFKGSLMADFVYHSWLEMKVSYMSGVGEVKSKAKNSDNVNSTQRLVTVWNRFVEANQGEWDNRYDAHYWSIDWRSYNWSYRTDGTVSLIQFLTDKATDYPDARLKTYEIANQLGL